MTRLLRRLGKPPSIHILTSSPLCHHPGWGVQSLSPPLHLLNKYWLQEAISLALQKIPLHRLSHTQLQCMFLFICWGVIRNVFLGGGL